MFRATVRLTNATSRGINTRAHFASSAVPATFLKREEVENRVIHVVKTFPSAPPTISPKALFVADLKFDSLHRKELVEKLSKEFCVRVPDAAADELISVEAAVNYFSSHPKARWALPYDA